MNNKPSLGDFIVISIVILMIVSFIAYIYFRRSHVVPVIPPVASETPFVPPVYPCEGEKCA